MNTRCLVIIAIMVIIGCGGCSLFIDKPLTVVLQHPETMDFVSCQVDGWETPYSYANNEQCVEGYKKQGYIVWGER